MSSLVKKYTIGKSRLARGHLDGFTVMEDGSLTADKGKVLHTLFLGCLDSSQQDCPWGRLCFEGELSVETVLIVRVFASNHSDFLNHQELTSYEDFLLNPEISPTRKEKLFAAVKASKFIGAKDVLLYEQKGQYLWIYIQVLGEGRVRLRNFRVFAPGDTFFHTFPEIYRNNGDFLHRYLSIFSSLYTDLQNTIDSLEQYVDIDCAPKEMLPILARWLGIVLDGNFLEENQLRSLLKNAFPLIKGKGSRGAIKKLIELFVSAPFYIVEQGQMLQSTETENHEGYEPPYGRNPYGFTIFINQPPDDKLQGKLLYFINQFKPLRCEVAIVFLGYSNGGMDKHCYLDINASLITPKMGYLDQAVSLGDIVLL